MIGSWDFSLAEQSAEGGKPNPIKKNIKIKRTLSKKKCGKPNRREAAAAKRDARRAGVRRRTRDCGSAGECEAEKGVSVGLKFLGVQFGFLPLEIA